MLSVSFRLIRVLVVCCRYILFYFIRMKENELHVINITLFVEIIDVFTLP